MNTNNNMQQYMIPLAIVAAGALIAIGIFFGGTDKMKDSSKQDDKAALVTIAMNPVTSDDHILGNPNADILMVEYSDTECPFCKQFQTTLHKVMDAFGKDGKVAWVYRHFPIEQLHPKAHKEAQATECANEQKGNDSFWKYLDEIYKVTPANNGLDPAELPKIAARVGLDVAKFEECLSSDQTASKVDAQYADARKAGGQGTPYTVFVVKKPIKDDVIDFVAAANANFNAPAGEELITVSSDKMKVGVSGAMPYSFLEELIKVLQK